MVKFFKINFSQSMILEFLHYIFVWFLDFSGPIVVYHIAGEIERMNNMQFLKYLCLHNYKVYWECLLRDLVLVLFGKLGHSKTCAHQVIFPDISLSAEWIGISLFPSLLNFKLWSITLVFFGLNSTSSVFLTLRLNLFVFSQFERLNKSLLIWFDKICSEECDCIILEDHLQNVRFWNILCTYVDHLCR